MPFDLDVIVYRENTITEELSISAQDPSLVTEKCLMS